MNATTTENTITISKPPYPYLGKNTAPNGGIIIVLFTERENGVVVFASKDEPTYKVGDFKCQWSEQMFTVYNGTVHLNNTTT